MNDRTLLWVSVVVVVGLHLPGLAAGPLADDPLRWVEAWTDGSATLRWFTQPFPDTPGPLPEAFSPKLYRPIWHLSFYLDVVLFGAPRGFAPLLGPRLESLCLHVLNVWLLGRLLRRHFPDAPWSLVAALYAVHPLLVEPTAWVSARCGLLATTGLLWAGVARHPVAVVGAVMLAALSKETGLVAPFLLAVWLPAETPGRTRNVALATAVVIGVLGVRTVILGTPLGGYADTLPLASGAWWTGLRGHISFLVVPVPLTVVGGWTRVVLGMLVLPLLAVGFRKGQGRVVAWLLVALLPTLSLFARPLDGLDARFLADAVPPVVVALVMGIQSVPGRWAAVLGGIIWLGLVGAAAERADAFREAAMRIETAREQPVPVLPATQRGVHLNANLWPALSEAPWADK